MKEVGGKTGREKSCNVLIRNKNSKINEKLIFHSYIRYVRPAKYL